MPDVLTINDIDVAKGEVKEIILNIARLPTHTEIELPVYVFRGKKDGPVLLLTAGLHGDEINGIEIIRRMIYEDALRPTSGSVIAVPIVNIFGFIHNSRKFLDGKDLNRSFPGSSKGSLASRTAAVVSQEILPQADFGVDFHTGGDSKMNYPHIRTDLQFTPNLELATAFAPPYIVNARGLDGSFRKAAGKREKYILTFEGGESLRLDELTISEGIQGIKRLMNHLKMQKFKVKKSIPAVLQGSKWIRARRSGLFRALISPGIEVKKSQLLGYITDPYGETEFKIRSNQNGFVIGVNQMCVVNRGDALVHIGYRENQ